jgi:nucleoside-diphosphate-sugar epimerase
MRVFVTGATGFIGSAVVPELLAAGHEVLGLARSDAGANWLGDQGAAVRRGDLADVDGLVTGAMACDATIHLAFIHDFSRYFENIETDRVAVTAMAQALAGSGKALAIASGTLMASHCDIATEADEAPLETTPRAASEAAVLGADGLRGVVLRLPPTVHGKTAMGFVSLMIEAARRNGVSAYVGDGQNRWPAVHQKDAATLFRLAVEKAPHSMRAHAAAEEGVPIRAIAEAIGATFDLPVRSLGEAEAEEHFGFLAGFVGRDNVTSSAKTREILGWKPEGPDLLTDIRENGNLARGS